MSCSARLPKYELSARSHKLRPERSAVDLLLTHPASDTNGSAVLPFVIPSEAEGSAVLQARPGNAFLGAVGAVRPGCTDSPTLSERRRRGTLSSTCISTLSVRQVSWRVPTGGSPVQVRSSSRLVVSVAWWKATTTTKRTQRLCGVGYRAAKCTRSLRPRRSTAPKATCVDPLCEGLSLSRGLRPLSRTKGTSRNLGDLAFGRAEICRAGPPGEGDEPKLMMNGREKSVPVVVAVKSMNETG